MLKWWENGVSLRRLHAWLIAIMLITTGIVIYSTYRLTSTFFHLSDAIEEHMELEKAAHELMDASNYLTEQVQRFTINGDLRFVDQYFTEAFESNRREKALLKMDINEDTKAAFRQLQEALNNSVKLMDREYYAMRLVIDARGYTNYPDALQKVQLSREDMALSAQDKINRATQMVLNDDYYDQKNRIREDMRASLEEVYKLMNDTETEELTTLQQGLGTVRIVILIQILSILLMVRLTAYLGIDPVLKAVDKINASSPIPVIGANEFRYLAKAYNKMYSKYRISLEHLNFKASHDGLTGAYNREGYDLILSGIDISTTYMMLFDVDDFKKVNDTYGHQIGDQVLMKLAQILKGVFRDDDYICRIGGDEFVVFMVHVSGVQRKLIESKLEQIGKELSDTSDGLPAVSLSVGIVHGKDVTDTTNLFEKTDAAMYESKRKGKHTYTFYEG